MSKTITISDEIFSKLKDQLVEEKVKEKKEKKFEIKSRWTGDVIYTSNKTTYKDVVEEAVGKGADLKGADLEGADLKDAYLEGAYLKGADFYHTKFYGKGGNTKINKNQVDDFLKALGIVVK